METCCRWLLNMSKTRTSGQPIGSGRSHRCMQNSNTSAECVVWITIIKCPPIQCACSHNYLFLPNNIMFPEWQFKLTRLLPLASRLCQKQITHTHNTKAHGITIKNFKLNFTSIQQQISRTLLSQSLNITSLLQFSFPNKLQTLDLYWYFLRERSLICTKIISISTDIFTSCDPFFGRDVISTVSCLNSLSRDLFYFNI